MAGDQEEQEAGARPAAKSVFDDLDLGLDDDEDEDLSSGPVAAVRNDDDPWGSDGSEEEGGPKRDRLAAQEEKTLRTKHFKEGFKDAVSSARQEALQEGFGAGFHEAFLLGVRTGRLVGYCSTFKDMEKEGSKRAELQVIMDRCSEQNHRQLGEQEIAELERQMNALT
mmetsp:Transcript_43366/g.67943  ORF Transcript_43366/g.67943 Transcript_43366/m.67943 type:complete len:168 (-) Transcript_43366:1182-1685(-)